MRKDRFLSGSWSLAVLAIALLALAGPAAAGSPRSREDSAAVSELSRRLDRVLRTRALRGARVAALVVRERDQQVLFARDPDRALTPASNAKILTALAALATFGPTYRFETVIEADAAIDERGEVGHLIVRGSGDPAINSEDWWRLASELHRLGLRRVRGDLVLDDTVFDRARWHPGWGKTSSRAYHAPVGGLAGNYGAFGVTVRPGRRRGDPVVVEVSPPVPYLRVANRARTTTSRGRSRVRVEREATADGELVVVSGALRIDAPEVVVYRSVLDPARYAGSILRLQLEAVGIGVGGQIRLAAPERQTELLRFDGRPLAEIVRLFMKYSNNAVAESLVKAVGARASGAPGSWQNGVPAVVDVLGSLGIDRRGFSLVDGSGLSYENKISPRTLVQALRIARRSFEFGPELVSSLPLAGRDGTLEKRAGAAQGRVRAKTGLLTRVTALSGLAQLPSGEPCLFSILLNGYRGSDEEAMDALDLFVAELVSQKSVAGAGG